MLKGRGKTIGTKYFSGSDVSIGIVIDVLRNQDCKSRDKQAGEHCVDSYVDLAPAEIHSKKYHYLIGSGRFAGCLGFKAFVQPQVLVGLFSDGLFNDLVDGGGVSYRITTGVVFQLFAKIQMIT